MHDQDCHPVNERASAERPIHVIFDASPTAYGPAETVCQLQLTRTLEVVGADGLEAANCSDCCRVLDAVFGDHPGDAADLLRRATVAGVRVVVGDQGRILFVRGRWWTEPLMDTIWDSECDIAAALSIPSFTDAERAAFDALRRRYQDLPPEDHAA